MYRLGAKRSGAGEQEGPGKLLGGGGGGTVPQVNAQLAMMTDALDIAVEAELQQQSGCQ